MVMVSGSGHKLADGRNRHWPMQRIVWLYDTGPTPPTAIAREGGGRVSTHVVQPIRANAHNAKENVK